MLVGSVVEWFRRDGCQDDSMSDGTTTRTRFGFGEVNFSSASLCVVFPGVTLRGLNTPTMIIFS